MVTVRLLPEDRTVEFERLNTVLQLLNRLGLGVNDALVIRGGILLTPDVRLGREEELVVRKVVSAG